MARYDDIVYDRITSHPMFRRFYPSKDVFHHELWRWNGTCFGDYTYTNDYWGRFYYPRRPPYPNIPSDERICSLHFIWNGPDTATLWALYNEIILDLYRL